MEVFKEGKSPKFGGFKDPWLPRAHLLF